MVVAVGALAGAPAASASCAHGADVAASLTTPARNAALLCVIGAQRSAHGVRAVQASSQLGVAAQGHADDMVAQQFFSHVSPEGSTLRSRVGLTGYTHGRRRWHLGEAIGWAQAPLDSADGMVDAWLASPPHRAILLDRTFRQVGIGVAPGLTDGSGVAGATAVLDFGSRTAWPARANGAHAR
jgi:uncharacterized protein YkwD